MNFELIFRSATRGYVACAVSLRMDDAYSYKQKRILSSNREHSFSISRG
jgi:hypothetical protein